MLFRAVNRDDFPTRDDYFGPTASGIGLPPAGLQSRGIFPPNMLSHLLRRLSSEKCGTRPGMKRAFKAAMAAMPRSSGCRFKVGDSVEISNTISTKHVGNVGRVIAVRTNRHSPTLDKYWVCLSTGEEVQ